MRSSVLVGHPRLLVIARRPYAPICRLFGLSGGGLKTVVGAALRSFSPVVVLRARQKALPVTLEPLEGEPQHIARRSRPRAFAVTLELVDSQRPVAVVLVEKSESLEQGRAVARGEVLRRKRFEKRVREVEQAVPAGHYLGPKALQFVLRHLPNTTRQRVAMRAGKQIPVLWRVCPSVLASEHDGWTKNDGVTALIDLDFNLRVSLEAECAPGLDG